MRQVLSHLSGVFSSFCLHFSVDSGKTSRRQYSGPLFPHPSAEFGSIELGDAGATRQGDPPLTVYWNEDDARIPNRNRLSHH
ncbi:hypothetical protein RRG08_045885 [Elysia crispata]|uniref:Uncharacterized protein n=1 Tax=Elysia crispata TaxID=231223 RepID=A0AAE0ZEW4_9GAST|nr:hypothetical protein RRG08_045885 [Elysia crispata]